jgi:hypothetical protein
MKGNFHETLEETATALPSDRSTGLVLATAATLAAIIWRHDPMILTTGLALGAVLASLSLAAPAVLHPLVKAWMALGHLLGRIVSPIVMLVLFAVTIVPFGIAMQLRRDPLRRRPTEADETFWIVPEIEFGPKDMNRQF